MFIIKSVCDSQQPSIWSLGYNSSNKRKVLYFFYYYLSKLQRVAYISLHFLSFNKLTKSLKFVFLFWILMRLLTYLLTLVSFNASAVTEDDTIFISGLETYQFPTGNINTGDTPLMLPTAETEFGIPERARKLFPDGYYPLRDVVYNNCILDVKQEVFPETNPYVLEWINGEQSYDANGNLLSVYFDTDGDFNWDSWNINSYDSFNNLINTKTYAVYTNSAGNSQSRLDFEDIYTYYYDALVQDRITHLEIERKTYLYQADGTPNGSQSIVSSSDYNYFIGGLYDGLIESEIWYFESIADVNVYYFYDGFRNLIEYQIAPSTAPSPRQFLAFDYGSDLLLAKFRKGLKNYQGTTILSEKTTEFSYVPITPFVSGFSEIATRSSSTNKWTARHKVDKQTYVNTENSPEPIAYCSGYEDYAWSTNDFPISIKYSGYPYDPLQTCEEYQEVTDFQITFSGSCTQ